MARSFWLHTVLLGWGVGLVGAWALSRAVDDGSARGGSTIVLVLEPLLLLLWAWGVTGTIVSALRHLARGERVGVALAVLGVLGLAFVGMAGHLRTVLPSLQEHWRVARGQQPTDGFRIEAHDGGRVVSFTGGVNEGAAPALGRREAEVYRKAGLSEDIVRRIAATPHDTLWIPTPAELRRADIVNR